MAKNLVSQPPLNVSLINPDGTPSRVWAVWFRDLYRRTGYKGGNAIDDLQIQLDKVEDSIPIDQSSMVQFIQKQIDGLPEFTIDTTGFTVDSTFITVDKVIA